MKESTLTPEHLAAKLLAGCPPGPVYEYLLTAAGKQAAKTVTVAPTEDETTWALLRGLDVDTACRLISLITSPELLHRILAMARRKNVRRAIAANPHLTDADVTTLAHEAALADKALAQALYEGRTPAGQVKLLLDHPQLGNYLDNVDGSFACAVYNSADDTVLRSIVGNPRRSATLETLDMVCGFSNEPRFGVPAVIEVAFALNLTKDEHVRDRVATYVCRNATDAELLGALAKLDWPTLRFAAAMARPHLVAGTVLGRAATGDELLQLAGKLSYGKIEIGVDVARKLAAHELPLCGWHRQLRLSSAGHDAFLTAVSDDVAVWFALQHPDPERRAEVLAARLNLSRVTIRRLELTVNLLLRLLDDGPVEAALGERAWVVLSSCSAAGPCRSANQRGGSGRGVGQCTQG
jgi:hypothetical protein